MWTPFPGSGPLEGMGIGVTGAGGHLGCAIAIGEGGFTPRSFADIEATRYGDCKDKAKLFVAMARALGLDACPALVNTAAGYALDTWLPSGVVFDHCIVRLAIGDQVYWLDGTRSLQLSPLDHVGPSSLGFALPLKPGATLERIPDPSSVHFLETRERVLQLGAAGFVAVVPAGF